MASKVLNSSGSAAGEPQPTRKAAKKGISFTMMVVGESGLGKSTFVKSLFPQQQNALYEGRAIPRASERIQSTTAIEKHCFDIEDKTMKLKMTVVDTPGFYDAVDAHDCIAPIVDYVDDTLEKYFKAESGLNRRNIEDHRVHCCLYFVSPLCHGLRQIDVELMRALHTKLNLIPLIAKADALTKSELRTLKSAVLDDIDRHQIQIYRPPSGCSDDESEVRAEFDHIRNAVPFAVIGSNCWVDAAVVRGSANGAGNGAGNASKKIRARQYAWGVVDIENTEHCDFSLLRDCILKSHMQDLIVLTNETHYENFRINLLQERMTRRQTDRSMCGTQRSSATPSNSSGNPNVSGSSGAAAPPSHESAAPPSHESAAELIRQKEEELQKMQAKMAAMESQLKASSMMAAAANQAANQTAPIAKSD